MRDVHKLRRDLALRAAGLFLLALGGAAMRFLFRDAPLPLGSVSFAGMALAAIGFAGLSIGSALLLVGGHLLGEVELSERWARREAARVGLVLHRPVGPITDEENALSLSPRAETAR